ncbi:phage holin family protein [Paenibacillus sp. TAB 01]|uniref:phage holin family protein n=1 Tax=Paenibacillus sp. TAB 01 TaxID=3368988 RepID=UPI0037519875
MEWNAIIQLLDPKLLIVLAACWVIGYVLKQTPRVPNWSIIFVVTAVAVAFTVSMLGVTPEAILQGILAGAVAVYGYEFLKATKQAKESDDDGKGV